MSAATEDKALRYLAGGHVRVQEVDLRTGFALIHVTPSDGGDPYLVRQMAGEWTCDCPARIPECSHVIASRLIVPAFPRHEHQLSRQHDASIDALLAAPRICIQGAGKPCTPDRVCRRCAGPGNVSG
jgi:hypothetical protein